MTVVFYAGTDYEGSFPPLTVLLNVKEYEEYLTFEGPMYERYHHILWSDQAVHVKDEVARDRWVEAENRWLDANDTLHLRDMWGNLKTTFAEREECKRIMEEAEREKDALEIREEIGDSLE